MEPCEMERLVVRPCDPAGQVSSPPRDSPEEGRTADRPSGASGQPNLEPGAPPATRLLQPIVWIRGRLERLQEMGAPSTRWPAPVIPGRIRASEER